MTMTAAEPTAQPDPGPPARVLYTEGRIRAGDLADGDALMVDGEWREVMDAWADDDLDAAKSMYPDPDSAGRKLLTGHLRGFSEYIVVRLLKETTEDSGSVEDSLTAFRAIDLVTVQVPAQ